MRVLILGGTRFIGPFVVRELARRGHEVVVFNRGRATAALPEGVRRILGDRAALRDFREDFRRAAPDVVVDMIPIREADMRAVLSAFTGIARRAVAISSQDVYLAYGRLIGTEPGPPISVPFDEDAPLRTRLYPYRKSGSEPVDEAQRRLWEYDKIPVERAVLEDDAIAGTVLRLPMVYGPGDGQHRLYEHLRRMEDGRPAILLGERMARWRWTRSYVEDVAAAISLAATDEKAAGRVYNVGDESLTMAEWVRAIGDAAYWSGKVVVVPEERLPEAMRTDMDTGQQMVASSERIRRELGWRETVSRHEGLLRTIEWELRNPPPNSNPPNYSAEDAVLKDRRHAAPPD